MAKLESLVILINSLSKGEKRYFKLTSSLQQGDKDYVRLFDYIEKGFETTEIKSLFLKDRSIPAFDVTCNYLYKNLLEGLVHLKQEKDLNAKLVLEIQKIKILFEKGLYEDGAKSLKKVQELAHESEMYVIELWTFLLELDYNSNLNFHPFTERQLLQKQMKVQKQLKLIQHTQQHIDLYRLLHQRLLNNGNVRTQHQKSDLNDLLVAELNIVSKQHEDGFTTQKIHFLFQAYYLIAIGDYKAAFKTFHELNNLFENHVHLWENAPTDYLMTLEGILDSIRGINRRQEIPYFLDKLQKIKRYSSFESITIDRINYTYLLLGHIDQGDFKAAENFVNQHASTLFSNIKLLDISKQAEVYFYTSIVYMGTGNMEKVRHYLNFILLESKIFYNLPVYRTFRLINLLVHYELGNYDYIKYEIRSVKRTMTDNESKAYLIEKIVFKFVQTEGFIPGKKESIQLWEKIKNQFDLIESDKYEFQLSKLFNFRLWIKSKLCKVSFASLLKQKALEASDTNSQ